jgi:beta-glucosidase
MVRPLKDLRGFERVMVKRGQRRVITMELSPEDLAVYHIDAGAYRVEKGLYEILVGPSSEDATLLSTTLTVR